MFRLVERRAISPVIATVILVAAGITVAVAISYWVAGLSMQYSQFEKVEIDSGYCVFTSAVTNARWEIILSLRNSGPSDTTLHYVFLNSKLVDEYGITSGGSLSSNSSIGTSIPVDGLPLTSGESATVSVWIGSALFSSGTSVEVNVHSAFGMDYIKLIKLS